MKNRSYSTTVKCLDVSTTFLIIYQLNQLWSHILTLTIKSYVSDIAAVGNILTPYENEWKGCPTKRVKYEIKYLNSKSRLSILHEKLLKIKVMFKWWNYQSFPNIKTNLSLIFLWYFHFLISNFHVIFVC